MADMEWKQTIEPVDYPLALAEMEARVAAIRAGEAPELVWLVEHPPLYTGGTSAKAADLVEARFPVYETGRGGQYTYHGPGQRIAYVMLDLKRRMQEPDLRRYVQTLEQWIINTLARFDIEGFIREGRVGVWVNCHPERSEGSPSMARDPSALPQDDNTTEKKIAALGIRVRQWVSYHGIALNVHPDLSHYSGIVPCGIRQYGVTSLWDMGVKASMAEVDAVLAQEFAALFSEAESI
jgi:lipoyl(octanoyl) transferase